MKSTFFSSTASFLAIVIATVGTLGALAPLGNLLNNPHPGMAGLFVLTSLSILGGSWTTAALLGTLAEIARK